VLKSICVRLCTLQLWLVLPNANGNKRSLIFLHWWFFLWRLLANWSSLNALRYHQHFPMWLKASPKSPPYSKEGDKGQTLSLCASWDWFKGPAKASIWTKQVRTCTFRKCYEQPVSLAPGFLQAAGTPITAPLRQTHTRSTGGNLLIYLLQDKTGQACKEAPHKLFRAA